MKNLISAALKKVGVHRGSPRVYLEGAAPTSAGFAPGVRFTIETRDEQQALVLRVAVTGDRVVSRKTKAGLEQPVIDINSAQALAAFVGMERVRVLVGSGEIWILPLAVEVNRRVRLKRLRDEVASGVVSTASIAHGVGVLSNALHRGLRDAGLQPSLRWAIEVEGDALEQAAANNDAWSTDTLALSMPLQEVAFSDHFVRSKLAQVSVLEAGLPCTAASVAGRSKKRLGKAEDDGAAGHLVAGFLALLARANPAVMLLENVVPYRSTSSAAILRTQLAELGYDVQEMVIDGGDYALETRSRMVMLAVTRGLDLDVSEFGARVKPGKPFATVGEVLEFVAEDDPRWSEMSYLKDKEVRDTAAGKGFRMAVAAPGDAGVGCLGTGYQKNRSTEAKVRHPSNPDLLRLFTPGEHAKLKGIPRQLIAGVSSATRAHEMLGQSVVWPAFRHLGAYIGQALREHRDESSPAFALDVATAA